MKHVTLLSDPQSPRGKTVMKFTKFVVNILQKGFTPVLLEMQYKIGSVLRYLTN